MRALVNTAPMHLEIQHVDGPDARAEEVLVRVQAVCIGSSDVHGYTGTTGRRVPPLIMGHELAGVVEYVGSRGTNIQFGDRVMLDCTIGCDACPAASEAQEAHAQRSSIES